MLRISILLLALSFGARAYLGTLDVPPVNMPLSLDTDGIQSVWYTAKQTSEEWITIAFRRGLPTDEVLALNQALMDPTRKTFEGRRLPYIECFVYQDGKEMKYGEYHGAFIGDMSGVVPRSVNAVKSQRYNVKVKVRPGDERYQSLDPHLQVVAHRPPVLFGLNAIQTWNVFFLLIQLVGWITFVIGMIRLARSRVAGRIARRAQG